MGTTAGHNINLSNISLYVDAYNPKSYSGTPTTWTDISGNNKNMTLVNGPTLSSGATSSIAFDGSNDYATSSLTISTMPVTFSCWLYFNSISTKGIFDSAPSQTNVLRGWDSFVEWWNSDPSINYTLVANKWYHLTFVYNYDTNRRLAYYLNGVFVSNASGSTTSTFSWSLLNLASINYSYFSNCRIANFKVYNSSLGNADIQKIYDAEKSQFNTPPTTDGLVLYLDAGTNLSYPGSGTTWYDLRGMANNSTLVNGPTYSSNNNGYITFDGINDYASFYAPSLDSVATIEMWAKISDTNNRMLFGFHYYDVWFYGQMGFNTASSDIYGISAATIASLGLVGNWKHYVFVMRSDVAYTNNKIYINNVEQSISQQSASENSSNRNFNSGVGKIATWGGLDRQMPMDCAVFRVYNKSLSSNEISQNFNAFRDRFNI